MNDWEPLKVYGVTFWGGGRGRIAARLMTVGREGLV